VLDSIDQSIADVVAPVEWHVNSGYPLYCAKAYNKWMLYPPPYQGGYATPWLWVDGKERGYDPNSWPNYVTNEKGVPSTVSITHTGTTYDSMVHVGTLKVECYNSGADTVKAALQFAITEDSIHYLGPNGDSIHNHVCRDYLPDEHGTSLTIAPAATDTVSVTFVIFPIWARQRVKFVVYVQNMQQQGDSSEPCYQGISGSLADFTGIQEPTRFSTGDIRVQVGPNPCRSGCEFNLSGVAAPGARIALYTPDGRLVSNVRSVGSRAIWNRNGAARGIYLYRVTSGTAAVEGKLVVTD